jgi:hypothetical protein
MVLEYNPVYILGILFICKEVENENEIKIPDIQLCPQRLGYGL